MTKDEQEIVRRVAAALVGARDLPPLDQARAAISALAHELAWMPGAAHALHLIGLARDAWPTPLVTARLPALTMSALGQLSASSSEEVFEHQRAQKWSGGDWCVWWCAYLPAAKHRCRELGIACPDDWTHIKNGPRRRGVSDRPAKRPAAVAAVKSTAEGRGR